MHIWKREIYDICHTELKKTVKFIRDFDNYLWLSLQSITIYAVNHFSN